MNEFGIPGPRPESAERAGEKKEFVYQQVSELPEPQAKGKTRYSAEELFGQNKFGLEQQDIDVLFGVYSFNEESSVSMWRRQGSPSEGVKALIADLRREIKENEDVYEYTVEDSDHLTDYTYPDLLTDATTYRGERIKQKILSTLIEANDLSAIVDPIMEEAEETAMMIDEFVSRDILSSVMYGLYGVTLEDDLVPQNIREEVEALINSPQYEE